MLLNEAASNLYEAIMDVATAVLFSLNVLPVWRYSLMYRKRQQGSLTRKDLLINPFFFLIDLPYVLMFVVTIVIGPWRILTTYRHLCRHHDHFPNLSKAMNINLIIEMRMIETKMMLFTFVQAISDWVFTPIYVVAVINPFNLKCAGSLFAKGMSY